MNIAANNDPSIQDVRITDDEIISQLADGRVISVPLAWSWRLSEATAAQRANWRLIGTGQGVHWPDVDEDLSVEGMLQGVPAPRPSVAIMKQRKPGHQKPPRKGARPRRKECNLGGDRTVRPMAHDESARLAPTKLSRHAFRAEKERSLRPDIYLATYERSVILRDASRKATLDPGANNASSDRISGAS